MNATHSSPNGNQGSVKQPPIEGGTMTLSSNFSELGNVMTAAPSEGNGITPLPTGELGTSQAANRPWWVKSSREWYEQYEGGGTRSAELWGPVLLRGTLTLLVGQSSIGKSVLMYRLADALVTGKELLGLVPPHPLRVLHIDLETPDDVRNDLFDSMAPGDTWDIVTMEHIPSVAEIEALAPQYDVVIIDSLQVFDPPYDEDSNSEANKQMNPLVSLAKRAKVAVLVTHNGGKGSELEQLRSKFYARGASARVDRADIVVNFYAMPRELETKELWVAKSRHGYNQKALTFKFAGDVDYALVKGLEIRQTKAEVLKGRVCELMADGKECTRQEIAEALSRDPKDSTFNRVLKGLVSEGKLRQPKPRGPYITGSIKDVSSQHTMTLPNSRETQDNVKLPGSRGGKVTLEEIAAMPMPQKAMRPNTRRPSRGGKPSWVKPAIAWSKTAR